MNLVQRASSLTFPALVPSLPHSSLPLIFLSGITTRQNPSLQPRLLLDLGPVDRVPPALRIRELAAHATGTGSVLAEPRVLPCVEAQDRDQISAAGSRRLKLGALVARRAARKEALAVGQTLLGAADGGLGVNLLTTPVGARVRGSGEVGGHDAEGDGGTGKLGAHEPDESRAEHGHGGPDHLVAQGLDGAEVLVDVKEQLLAHLDGDRGKVVEEEVVVVRHGGVVEHVCELGVAGGGEDDGLDVFLLEFGACLGTKEGKVVS